MPPGPTTIENGVGGARIGSTTPYAAVAIRTSGSKAISYPRPRARTRWVFCPDGSHDETATTRTSAWALAHASSSSRFAVQLVSQVGPKNENNVVRRSGPARRGEPLGAAN